MENTEYILLLWPEYQEIMKKEDWRDNSYHCNDDKLLDSYGRDGYFVEKDWYIENCIPHKDFNSDKEYNEGDIIKFKDGTIAKATKAICGCNHCIFTSKSALFCDDIHCNNGNGSFIFICLKKGENYYDEY